MANVLLLGASGGMGRRIAALAKSAAPSVALRWGVRRLESVPAAAGEAEVVMARLDDTAGLREAIAGVSVVINAVGPYAYDPVPLLEACADQKAHYVDLASEPEFLVAVEAWSARPGVRIAVCPGASTVPGLIELSATHIVDRLARPIAAFDVFLSMGSGNKLTPGLLSSLTLQLGVPLRSPEGGVSYRTLRRRDLHGLGSRLFGRYPSPFDAQGMTLREQRVPAKFWVGLDRRWIVHALRALSCMRPRFRDRTWIRLAEAARPFVGLANRFGGFQGGMRIEALDEAHRVIAAVNYHAPREALNIPALPSLWAAKELLEDGRPGYRPLQTLVTFEAAANSLGAQGFEVIEEFGDGPDRS